jgi:hypothetical protein
MFAIPNVNQDLSLSFEIKKAGNVKIELIDITGKSVVEFYKGAELAGLFSEKFRIPSMNNGLYFLRIQVAEDVLTRKLLVQQ